MKSTLNNEGKTEGSPFPCLKEWAVEKQSTFVVLFTGEKTGTVVHAGNSDWELGNHIDSWVDASSKDWKDYSGRVVLQN